MGTLPHCRLGYNDGAEERRRRIRNARTRIRRQYGKVELTGVFLAVTSSYEFVRDVVDDHIACGEDFPAPL
jgi:hypothetical protein